MKTYSTLVDGLTPIRLTVYESAITKKGGAPVGEVEDVKFKSLGELAETFGAGPATRKVKRRSITFTPGFCDDPDKIRLKENIAPPYLVLLDFDKVTRPIEWVSARLALHGVDHVGYTTFSHGMVEDEHSFRIMTDHVARTWGELRDIVEQVFELVHIEATQESYNSVTWFAPTVHEERAHLYEYVASLTGGSSWFPERRNADEYDKPRPKRERSEVTPEELVEVESALEAIPNEDVHYDDWLEIGMALHDTGTDEALDLWIEWSAKSGKHDSDYCERKWDSFHEGREHAVTLGTVFHYAHAHGWEGLIDPTPTAAVDFDNYVREAAREPEEADSDEDEEPAPVIVPVRWRAQLDGDSLTLATAMRIMNKRFAHVLEQGSIIDTDGDRLAFHKSRSFLESFTSPLLPHPTKVDKNDNPLPTPLGSLWLNSKKRRTYERIDFLPPGGPDYLGPDVFNRWLGFGVDPIEGENHRPLIEHVFENVAAGNAERARWIVAWMAHLVQRPFEKVGTALVLHSPEEGTGKGVLGNAIYDMIGSQHSVKVDHQDRLTGRFNAHLYGKVFVFADEVTWGGNRKDAGFLRTMVSEPISQYEEKNIPAFSARSFTRLLVTGNDAHLVPASATSRRWQFCEVSARHMQDHPYFGRIVNSLRRGGLSHLLHYLLELDLDDYPDPRIAQDSAGLTGQKIESLDPIDRWLYGVLLDGYFTLPHMDIITDAQEWPEEMPKETLFVSFKAAAGGKALYHADKVAVGKRITETFGSLVRSARVSAGVGQQRIYRFPPLDVMRKQFANKMGLGESAWPDDPEEE